jgi:hypothetical protein
MTHHSRNAWEQYGKRELSVTEIDRLAGESSQTLYRYLRISRDKSSTSAA